MVATENPPAERSRVTFTYEMVQALLRAGIDFGAPFELLQGDIVYKMPKNYPHILATNKILRWIYGVFGVNRVLRQDSILLAPTNAPEPDATLLRQAIDHYASVPGGSDVLLIIEVADTTLAFDRDTKANWYAAAHIPEYWVVDINGRQLLVYRDPQNGSYRSVTIYGETETVAPLAAPNVGVLVSDLLP